MAPGELHPEPAPPRDGRPLSPELPPESEPRTPAHVKSTGGRGRRILWGTSGLALMLAGAGAGAWFLWGGEDDLQGPGVYHGFGVVVEVVPAPSQLDATRPVVVLRHEPIKDLMDEGMTHPFLVRSERLLRGITPGTRVRFTLKDTPGALLVVRLEKNL